VLLLQVPSLSLRPCRKRFTTLRPSSLTRRCCVRLSPIAQYSLLLPPVGVWAVSQSQCGRSPSQAGYPSKPWWAVTLTNKLIGREPILGRKTFHFRRCRRKSYPVLAPLSRSYPRAKGRLLTCYSPVRRSSTPKGLSARLACMKHAASVRPEPGSNSPLKSYVRPGEPG
jgi:hypothetical protein